MLDTTRRATVYRMVMEKHVCPYGLKTKDLLEREGFQVDDHWLTTREETDAFKAEHGVKTTPQTFIGGQRIGGYDDLRRHLGKAVKDPKATSYTPVVAVFAMTALMALAASYTAYGTPLTIRAGEWFIAFSMCVLAILKLQTRDLLVHVPGLRSARPPLGALRLRLPVLRGPGRRADGRGCSELAFNSGCARHRHGRAVSVFKAVYVDKREIKCACVGGSGACRSASCR